jgi:hypothetical protein
MKAFYLQGTKHNHLTKVFHLYDILIKSFDEGFSPSWNAAKLFDEGFLHSMDYEKSFDESFSPS